MGETKIIRRYGCDGCNTLYKDPDYLNVVKVQVMRKGEYRVDIAYETQTRSYCHKCLVERTPRS